MILSSYSMFGRSSSGNTSIGTRRTRWHRRTIRRAKCMIITKRLRSLLRRIFLRGTLPTWGPRCRTKLRRRLLHCPKLRPKGGTIRPAPMIRAWLAEIWRKKKSDLTNNRTLTRRSSLKRNCPRSSPANGTPKQMRRPTRSRNRASNRCPTGNNTKTHSNSSIKLNS